MKDPEISFPEKKLNVRKSEKKKDFKKRDMKTFLENKLNVNWRDDDFVSIPIDTEKKISLLIYRFTVSRMAVWGVNGIYENFRRVGKTEIVAFPETEEIAEFLWKLQKKLMKTTDVNSKLRIVNKELKSKKEELKKRV